MSRSVPEWVGKNHDSAIPARVRLRVWDRAGGYCSMCRRKIAAETWECDHIRALVNGGTNSEDNLQVLCSWCHKSQKTKDDVAIKSYNYKRRLANAGIKRTRRPMLGSKDSGWKVTFGRGVVRR